MNDSPSNKGDEVSHLTLLLDLLGQFTPSLYVKHLRGTLCTAQMQFNLGAGTTRVRRLSWLSFAAFSLGRSGG